MTKKTIQVYPLRNTSIGYEDYDLVRINRQLLDESREQGGSEKMKDLLRERLSDLFNNEIQEYFDEDVTQDFEDCIDTLAKGDAACIKDEQFWWGDVEDVVIEL